MLTALRFLWRATRGHRLAPWRSPYLRWRIETYTGIAAELITVRDVLQLLWAERRQFLRFLRWVVTMERLAGTGMRPVVLRG